MKTRKSTQTLPKFARLPPPPNLDAAKTTGVNAVTAWSNQDARASNDVSIRAGECPRASNVLQETRDKAERLFDTIKADFSQGAEAEWPGMSSKRRWSSRCPASRR